MDSMDKDVARDISRKFGNLFEELYRETGVALGSVSVDWVWVGTAAKPYGHVMGLMDLNPAHYDPLELNAALEATRG